MLRVLPHPSPTIDLSTLQAKISSYRFDVDTMIDALFKVFNKPKFKTCNPTKRYYSSRTTEKRDDACLRNKDKTYLKVARRYHLIDEESRQMRARQMAIRASSSILVTGEMITSDGVEIVVGTTEGDQSTVVVRHTKDMHV